MTELILTGELGAGAPVREVELARRFGTSRTPVREAISQLVARGLITKEGGRSAHVREPTLEDILELYELRVLTESYLAGKAAESIDEQRLERLVHLEEKLRTTEGETWHERHAEFHTTIFEAAGRPRFSRLASDLRIQSEPYVRLAAKLDSSLLITASKEHTQLLESMKNRSPDTARQVTSKHLNSTVSAVDRVFRAARGLSIPVKLSNETSSHLIGG